MKKHILLWKIQSPFSYLLYEKSEKNNKSVQVSWRNTSGKLLVLLLVPGVFSRTWTVVDIRFFYAISAMLQLLQQCCSCCMRSQQCCRDCSNVAEIAVMLHLLHAISATTATSQRLHATNETQNMCHVTLPKGRQSGVSQIQQRGLNLTDNASTVSLFCRCCCPVVPSNVSSYCLLHCPPLYRRTSSTTSRRIINQRSMQQMRCKKGAILRFWRAGIRERFHCWRRHSSNSRGSRGEMKAGAGDITINQNNGHGDVQESVGGAKSWPNFQSVGDMVVRWLLLLGGRGRPWWTRCLQAMAFGGMRKCSVVGEEGGGTTDDVGVAGRGI